MAQNCNLSNIKLFRKHKGFTQEEVAERLGVSRQAVAKWENGGVVPDIENIIALADLFEVSVDVLVRLSPESELSGDKKHIFGISGVNDKGQITLPKKCRDVFGIKAGDKMLILGDESKGIAMVKVPEVIDVK